MHALTLFTGILSLIGSSLALPESKPFDSVKSLPDGWTRLRAPAPETRIRLRIALDHPKQKSFEETLLAVSTPDHPQYGQHLSQKQLKSMLQPRSSSTSAVLSWLQSSNIPSADIEDDGEWINFYVAIATAEQMLSTKFYVFKHAEDKKEIIRTLQYSLPRSVSSHVALVQPTTKFSRMMAERRSSNNVDPPSDVARRHEKSSKIPSTTLDVAACKTSITPDCLRALYKVGDYKADTSASSLLGIGGFENQVATHPELQTFLEMYAPYAAGSDFTAQGVNGANNTLTSLKASGEANTDVQYGMVMSYGVPITYYNVDGHDESVPDFDDPGNKANEPFLDFLHYILKLPDSKLPQTIAISYGTPEQMNPQGYAKIVCNMFGQLGARGVSVLIASGDFGTGSACQTNDGKNSSHFTPIFPATCPWITSVGATGDVEPERGVNFSSGGFSDIFPRPQYQEEAVSKYLDTLGDKWAGLYNPTGRGFPDVAAYGQLNMQLIDSSGNSTGGTSASAPVMAGIVALLNNARTSMGQPPLGFLNPWLYSTGLSGLTDIVDGGSTGCTGSDFHTTEPTRYIPYASWNATEGWDPVTGLGTPNFEKLLKLSSPDAPWRSMGGERCGC